VMSRIAAPMLGGMVTAPLLSLFIVPAAYALMRRRSGFGWSPRPSQRINAPEPSSRP